MQSGVFDGGQDVNAAGGGILQWKCAPREIIVLNIDNNQRFFIFSPCKNNNGQPGLFSRPSAGSSLVSDRAVKKDVPRHDSMGAAQLGKMRQLSTSGITRYPDHFL